MSSLETLTLDGLSLNDGTTFDLEGFEFNPAQKRQRWISGEDADGDVLAEPSRAGNRTATVTLRVVQQASMDLALAKIGQIQDKLYEAEQQPDGLALVWTPADATKSATAYVLSGEIIGLPVAIDAGWFVKAPQIIIRLDCLPYMEGTEVTSAATLTDSNPAQILTVGGVTGDVPAKARLVVTDAATQSRRHLEWGLQWRYYDAATSLLIDSDSLVTSGFGGTGTTRTGAYDPGAAGNSVIRGTLTSTTVAVCGTGNLGHVGTFRVKARVYCVPTSDADPWDFNIRLSWREGDGPLRSNAYTSPVAVNAWTEVDLGVISIPPKALGTQRWTGQIEAYSEDAGDTIDVDYIVLIPTAEGYGKARATLAAAATPTAFTARDEFDQTAGNLNAKSLPVGGTWATSGAATDLAVESTGHTLQRSTTADTGTGRHAIPSLAASTTQAVQVDHSISAGSGLHGVVARWADLNNYFVARINNTTQQILALKYIAGSPTTLASTNATISLGTTYTIRCAVFSDGTFAIWFGERGSVSAEPLLTGSDSALATGGTLASGQVGIRDWNQSATASTRTWDNFAAWTPSTDAAIFSGRSAEIRHDIAGRYDSTGTYFGAMASYRGAHFFLPPAGDENRTSRILVKARRNDIDTIADDQIADSTTVTVHYTPRYSSVPR